MTLRCTATNGLDNPVLMEEGKDDAEALPIVARHLVLKVGFMMKSKAFMLTFSSKEFTAGTWQPFQTWVKAKARKLHARHWAACLEESQHARAAGNHSESICEVNAGSG